jgi:hypothetical protein
MTYAKPEIAFIAPSNTAIHGSDSKWPFIFYLDANGRDYDALSPAYEADE